MKTAVEHTFTGTTSYTTGTYSSSLTMIGSLITQYTGASSTDKYITVPPPVLSNNLEATLQSFFLPHVYQWSPDIYWVFSASNAVAAVTRNISLHEYDVSANSITWRGYVTLSGTTIAGAKTIRGLRSHVTEYSTGTVSTSGTSSTCTGIGTNFQTARIAAGARIGFGTTDPTQVSTWYEIASIASETSLTLTGTANVSAGPYVIEEIRLSIACTNATLYNGGIHLIKGLNYGTFTSGGTIIAEATTVDNIRASYLLRDKANQTATLTSGSSNIGVTAHGFVAGDLVSFSTTGSMTTIVVNTTYYVISTGLTADNFQVSATLGGAALVSGANSGVHTVYSGNLNIGMGISIDETTLSNTNVDCCFLNNDNATTTRITKFNLRSALTVSGGISVSAYTLKTLGVTTVGTVQQVGNGRIFSVSHGAASGIKSLYFVTSSRVYRCAFSDITLNSSTWLTDFMLENPPGTITANLATAALLQVDYSSSIDRLLISTTSAGRQGTYVTKYDTASPQFEKIFGQQSNRTKLTTTPSGASDGFFPSAALTIWTEGGVLFAMPNVVTTGLNWLGILYIGADGYYAADTEQYVITPKLATPNISTFYRVYAHTNQYTGDFNLGYTPEPIRIYYRTSGIDDNSGEWTETISGDLSGASPGTYIQFKIHFDVMGEFCIPRRLYSIACTYEDGGSDSQDSHYLSSADFSDRNTKTFAWKHSVAFGYAVPTLRIRLYNAITDGILDDDDSVTQTGTWQRSTDGGSNWATYSTDDKSNNTTFIRFTPASIPDNVQVKALLTLN
jgi:hypothetical protein